MSNKPGSSSYGHGDAGGAYGDYAHGFDFNAFMSNPSNYSHIGVKSKGGKKPRGKRPGRSREQNKTHRDNVAYAKAARRGR
jgi:hypothetical protein